MATTVEKPCKYIRQEHPHIGTSHVLPSSHESDDLRVRSFVCRDAACHEFCACQLCVTSNSLFWNNKDEPVACTMWKFGAATTNGASCAQGGRERGLLTQQVVVDSSRELEEATNTNVREVQRGHQSRRSCCRENVQDLDGSGGTHV